MNTQDLSIQATTIHETVKMFEAYHFYEIKNAIDSFLKSVNDPRVVHLQYAVSPNVGKFAASEPSLFTCIMVVQHWTYSS